MTVDEGTRGRLVEAARPLFAEKGFERTSVREIARRAGVNPAALSYYFGGKEGLYKAVLEGIWAEMESHFSGVLSPELRPMDRIERFVRGLFSFHAANPFLVRFINREMADPTSCFESVIVPHVGKLAAALRAAISEAVAVGEMKRDTDPDVAALMLASMSNYLFLIGPVARRVILGPERDVGALPDKILSIFRNGVSSHEA